MSTAKKYQPHYVVADYQQWEGHWELWFGTAVSMAPSPFGPHERVVSEISFQIQSSIKKQTKCCECKVYTGLDWIVQNDTVVRPDLMIVRGEQPELHLERSPSLIVEVLSESTSQKDQTVKRELYEHCGVKYYLIADPLLKKIQLLILGPTGTFVDGSTQFADDGKFAIDLHELCMISFDCKSAFA